MTVVSNNLDYFHSYTSHIGPICALDSPPLAFLLEEGRGMPTYQFSCFTTILRSHRNNYKETANNRDLIMLVDVRPELLPPNVAKQGEIFVANVKQDDFNVREARLQHGYNMPRNSIIGTPARQK